MLVPTLSLVSKHRPQPRRKSVHCHSSIQHIRLCPETVCHHLLHCYYYWLLLLCWQIPQNYLSSSLSVCQMWPKHEVFSKSFLNAVKWPSTGACPSCSLNTPRCACASGWAKGLEKGWDPYYAYLCFRADNWTQLPQRLIFSCSSHTKNTFLANHCLHWWRKAIFYISQPECSK